MKNFIRFLFIYLVFIAVIISFYITIIGKYEKQLLSTQNELVGVVYLKSIYQLSVNMGEYIGHAELNIDQKKINASQAHIRKDIDTILLLQKKHPQLVNNDLNKKLETIRTFQSDDIEYYDFLDYINHENYRIGDVSGLLFEADRKMYFLGTLITHYMPEYLISVLLTHNIIEELIQREEVNDNKKNLYLEHSKLVYLSSEELDGIIELLSPYADTHKLSRLIDQTISKLELMSQSINVSPWQESTQSLNTYLGVSHEVLNLAHQLNDEYMSLIESTLKDREVFLQEHILSNRMLFLFIIVLFTAVLIYFYRIYNSNSKKEEELKNNNDILDKLVVFSKTDKEGNITYVSTALEELSGFKRDELIGETHRLFRHQDMDNSVYDELWTTILQKRTWEGELINRAKDGSFYWVKATIIPELDTKGEITGFAAFREDISNRKQVEIEKTKTQEALDFKSKFLSNMSHEIRTPLGGVIGLTHMALRTDLDEKQKDLLCKIDSTSNILLGVINDILDISKIESGKMTIEKEPFDLNKTIHNIENMLSSKVSEQGIKFNVDYIDITDFSFIGDQLRISQVLTNLLSNAIKFTAKGSVQLRVKSLGHDLVRFEVKDTGIGLKEEEIKELFKEFTQADMSTSRKYGGTGLGLAITKNLIELMGGRIWIESEFAKGSTFTFQIPLEATVAGQDSCDETMEDADTLKLKLSSLDETHVLLAEDHHMNQLIVEMALEDTKVKVDTAVDGEIAVEMFKSKAYDLVLMDIQMPKMNGYEASEAIRKIDADTPIVALSANVMQEDIQKSLDAGMNEHLAKPIEFDKLYMTLLKYFTNKKG